MMYLPGVPHKLKTLKGPAVQYELEALEDLITDNLHPKLLLLKAPNVRQLTEWMLLAENEKDRIRKKIRKVASSFVKEGRKENYLQLQQSGIIRLCDTVFHYLLPKDIASLHTVGKEINTENLYKTIYLILEELLHYLKENFPKYFDNNEKILDAYKMHNEPEIERKLKLIKKQLQHGKLKPAFIELVCEPFENFLLFFQSCSYRDLGYLHELQDTILDISKSKTDNLEDIITDKLFFLNFNSILFYNYYILKLKEEASQRKTVTDLVEFYSWQIKVLNQQLVKPNSIYLQHLEPIRDQLVFWIAEDLHYLNKKHQLTLALPVARETAKDKAKKVHVTLTVPDLALGARLLLDDVIINSNYTELMERVAKYFRTNRRESLSNNNTYNEGFNISIVTKEKMKGLLLKLSRKVNEF